MAGQALHGGLELALEQAHNDGPVQLFMIFPGHAGCFHIPVLAEILLLDVLPFLYLCENTNCIVTGDHYLDTRSGGGGRGEVGEGRCQFQWKLQDSRLKFI